MRARARRHRGASAKKFGFCQSEREHFTSVAGHCGLLRRTPDAAWWARHPLAYLVEAADDICYRLVDFEDGFRLGILPYREVSEAFLELIPPAKRPARLSEPRTDMRRVQILRAMAIGSALELCVEAFLAHEMEILAGTFDTPLIDITPHQACWSAIQNRSVETIYATARGVEIEAAGFEVLGGLLDVFVSALNDCTRGHTASTRSSKLLQLVPAECLGPHRAPDPDPYLRLLKILDFVSGMTDSYAVSLYKKVRGISLPGSMDQRTT